MSDTDDVYGKGMHIMGTRRNSDTITVECAAPLHNAVPPNENEARGDVDT